MRACWSLEQQPDQLHRARLLSAGGQHAGQWLTVFPITIWGTVRARHYQIALRLRLGCVLLEFAPVHGVAPVCGGGRATDGCGELHDMFGFHPGACRRGNRFGLWTIRHDAVQLMLLHVIRVLGYAAQSVSSGAGNWFGAAAYVGGSDRYRTADLVLPHRWGSGRHLFLDVAVTSPSTGAALRAYPSSATLAGVAAEQRAAAKVAKYGSLAAGVSSTFRVGLYQDFFCFPTLF